MRSRLLNRFDRAHRRVFAIDVYVDAEGRRIDVELADFEGRPRFAVLNVFVDLADKDRIARAGH